MKKNRINRCLVTLAILCVMVMLVAVPLASAASYSKVYGQTQDRIRVRESASTNATIIDNIVKNACVYVTSSRASGSSTFVQIKYRNLDGDVATGWACQADGNETYIKILSTDQAKKAFSVSGGNLPGKKVGTFTSTERKASADDSDNTYIKLNSSGTAVKNLQAKLQKLGFYSAELTGNCGPKTEQAIKDFQSRYGLTADGVAGPQTLAKIDAVSDAGGGAAAAEGGSGLRLNSTGTQVSNLQTDLTTLGYYWAEITGKFGEKTETAVKRFQEENGLPVDGVAGKKTLNAIASAVAAKGGVSAAGGVTSTTGTVLKLNSQGTKVSQLQTNLKSLGIYSAEITGNFGPKTEAAVKAFQKKHNLTPDGIAGPQTLAAIAGATGTGNVSSNGGGSGLRPGSTGEAVSNLQTNLTTLGYYYGDITGHYGSLTQQAVSKFQKSRRLTQDGIAGATTLAAIASAVQGTGSTPAGSVTGTALREGDRGTRVGDLQTRLKSLGYYYGEITNHFGTLTKQAVKKFQDANKLTVDGIAGINTLNKLYAMTGGDSSSSSPSGSGAGSTVTTGDSYGKVIKNNVYLRSKPSRSSSAVASLGNGTMVRISKIYTGNDGVKWYYVSVKVGKYTYKGYIRSDMMETIGADEYNNAVGDSGNSVGDQETLGMIIVTGDKVRLRYNPSTSAEAVGTANKGDTFYYVDSVDGWFQTKTGYWISKDYARVLKDDEIKDYVGSGSVDTTTTYRYGSTGSTVKYIQTALRALNYYGEQYSISGSFGPQTEAAVKRFQKAHGLAADGVVGGATMKLLVEKYEATLGGGNPSVAYNDIIYNPNWALADVRTKLANYGLTKEKSDKGLITLTDKETGKSFKIHIQSAGKSHIDAEPLTRSDTATMCGIYGVIDPNKISWRRRAMILTLEYGTSASMQVICSVYGEPHGHEDITSNGFGGQFCIHLRGSTINSGDGGNVSDSENHQAIIRNAANDLNGKKVGDRTIKVEETLP